MDSNLNFLTAPTSNPTPVGPLNNNTGLDPNLAKPMSGQEFAGVMRDLMAQGERQTIAETAPTGQTGDLTASNLQTFHLGEEFSVITAAQPLPDPNSLVQFARSQGLSESAVQTLFGDLIPASPSPSFNTQQLGDQPPSVPLDVNLQVPVTSMDSAMTTNLIQFGLTGMPVKPPVALDNTMTLPQSAVSLGWVQAPASSLAISNQIEQPTGIQAPVMVDAGNKTSDLNAMLQTAGASVAIHAMGSVDAKGLQTPALTGDLNELPPELGPLDAMRMRLVPVWENMTRQLAKLNGADQVSAWGQLANPLINQQLRKDEAPEVLLDLGDENDELLGSLDAFSDDSNTQPLDSARQTAASGTLGAAATSAAMAKPEMTDRAAQIQDLADKLGKAMGERLQEQIEKGEWRLQLKLNPAHLGKIDIELGMKSGALDAVFKTDNSITRELISQGANKLKDSLADSGMTVANVWVNSENQRESGRNSTPRTYNSENARVVVGQVEPVAAVNNVKDVRSTDAWDTLA